MITDTSHERVVDASGWRELRATADTAADAGAVADAGAAPLASGVEVALVAEELARGLADAPFLGATLAADLRRRAGVVLSSGPETVVLAPDLSGPVVHRGPDGAPAGVAVDARHAPAALTLMAAPEGALLATVPLAGPVPRADLTRPFGLLAASARPVPVPGARPLTAGDLDSWTALGLALACADLVGIMTGAVRLARDYASVRGQYGRPIGSFQAVAHMLADAAVAAEGSRSIARHAAWAVDALPPGEALAAAAAAKAYCARAVARPARHGGTSPAARIVAVGRGVRP
jgi:hypothetical protein